MSPPPDLPHFLTRENSHCCVWCVSRVLGPLPDHGFQSFDLAFPPRKPWPKDVHSTQLTTVAATRQARFYFHLNSQHLGKELGSYSGPTPAEGGEPTGSFCNLSLTWTQKTKVILSAAETQLPFMLPPGPGSCLLSSTEAPLSWRGTVASLPAPLPANRCAWRSLWTCPEHTASFFSGPCSFGAARLVAGSVAQSLQKRRVRSTDRPSFCQSKGHSQWPAWDAVPAAAPRGRSKAPGEAFVPKQATSF